MDYATPHAFDVGYSNGKHGYTATGGAVAASLVMSKREKMQVPR